MLISGKHAHAPRRFSELLLFAAKLAEMKELKSKSSFPKKDFRSHKVDDWTIFSGLRLLKSSFEK